MSVMKHIRLPDGTPDPNPTRDRTFILTETGAMSGEAMNNQHKPKPYAHTAIRIQPGKGGVTINILPHDGTGSEQGL